LRTRVAFCPTCRRTGCQPPPVDTAQPPLETAKPIRDLVPAEKRGAAYDMHKVLDSLVDEDSFFELKPCGARSS